MRALFTAKNALLIVILLCSMCSLFGWLSNHEYPNSNSIVEFEWKYSPDKLTYEKGEIVVVEYSARINKARTGYKSGDKVHLVVNRMTINQQKLFDLLTHKMKQPVRYLEDKGPREMLLTDNAVMTGYVKARFQKRHSLGLSFSYFVVTDENEESIRELIENHVGEEKKHDYIQPPSSVQFGNIRIVSKERMKNYYRYRRVYNTDCEPQRVEVNKNPSPNFNAPSK
ncbi:MAG: hypothetical protein K8S56_06645 [Candidatus Cloacimonetes bacterium]|nr:hypothetical protein [Candidatus Cloacimonadota bacterium]